MTSGVEQAERQDNRQFELAGAVERLRTKSHRYARSGDRFNIQYVRSDEYEDLQAVADAYLAEHPADDGEAITEDWLRSVGFSESNMNGQSMLISCDCGDPVEMWIEEDGLVSLVQSNVNDHVCLTGKKYATRGQLRRLCLALGIQLKEPS